jgi:hypothetical protein
MRATRRHHHPRQSKHPARIQPALALKKATPHSPGTPQIIADSLGSKDSPSYFRNARESAAADKRQSSTRPALTAGARPEKAKAALSGFFYIRRALHIRKSRLC